MILCVYVYYIATRQNDPLEITLGQVGLHFCKFQWGKKEKEPCASEGMQQSHMTIWMVSYP